MAMLSGINADSSAMLSGVSNKGAASADLTIDSWANRPAGSDGDRFQVTGGAIYRYSSTIGEWVRPFVYDGTPVLDARITGTVAPSAESPAWTDTTSSGTITSDGTKVTFDTSGANSHTAYSVLTHGVAGANTFMVGRVEVFTGGGLYSGSLAQSWWIQEGSVFTVVKLDSDSASQVLLMGSSLHLLDEDLTASERYLELYFSESSSVFGALSTVIYVDHSTTPTETLRTSATAGHSGSAAQVLGDATGAATGKFTIRELFAGRW